MKLGIYTASTPSHAYALTAQARALQSAIIYAGIKNKNIVICLVCSDDDFADETAAVYRELLPGSKIIVTREPQWAEGKSDNYKNPAQLMIAQMRTFGTGTLLAEGCDRILSMDSDVLPPHNSIQCMLTMLDFDKGYYQVAACPYPSQGGGPFLGGRGTLQNPILPDHYEDEKDIPKKLLEKRDKLRGKIDAICADHKEPPKEEIDKLHDLEKEIKEIPPRDNVFGLNAKRWRQRGWFDNAYPAIGKGAIVPTEWVGCGCTMMTRDAAAMCDWTGYNGGGTEDLYICFKRWQPNNVRIATIAHCPCDHVVRDRNNPKRFIHVQAFHELGGECDGHLRQVNVPWYSQDPGEEFDESNNGQHTQLIANTAISK